MFALDKRQFLLRVPRLLATAQARDGDAYDQLIYGFQRPVSWRWYGELLRYLGRAVPSRLPKGTARALERYLRSSRYPELGDPRHLAKVPGMDATVAVGLLHMDITSYPLIEPGMLAGLQALGHPVRWGAALDRTTKANYDRVLRIFDRLKLDIPVKSVPEVHLHLARILQLSLGELHRTTSTRSAAAWRPRVRRGGRGQATAKARRRTGARA